MVNKNTDYKFNKKNHTKIIFYIIVSLYILGLISGCIFTIKNAGNIDFVKKITLTEKLSQSENNSFFGAYMRCFIRDIIFIAVTLIYKYAGILKGFCITVPFIAGIQNASIYLSNFIGGQGIVRIIIGYILKDTATAFLLIMYCAIIVQEIITDRYNLKKDYYRISVYLFGVITVYIIDFFIKFFIG